ncbi:MAG: aldehyde ferredoxin oxidoreductase [Candidatus Dadabacteria bacterium]|nr:MAG: aldehyde ferredoxin oxidoreductase [Candidatus Dadabacteria bacterium]
MARILRIDLTNQRSSWQELPDAYRGLGGRGLTSAVVAAEVPPDAEPLGPENRLVLAPGLLAGTAVPNNGRLSVGAKSPLTGTIKESNAGGALAQKLARLGVAAVVLEGAASSPTVVSIRAGGVEFRPAEDLWGRGAYETAGRLGERFPGCAFALVGPAGEKGCRASAVCVTTPDGFLRTAARGGLGAVLGTKGVKAVVVDDAGGPGVSVAEPDRFRAAAKALAEGIAAHPMVGGLQALGTSMLVGLINELGGLPTRNYSSGRFEGAGRIAGEALAGIMGRRPNASTRHRCMAGCVIHCSQVYTAEDGEVITSGFEYETLGMVGSNCAIDDPDAIARLDRACDDLGLDTMEIGAAAAVAMEAGALAWGDGAALLEALRSIPADGRLGLLLAGGSVATGRELGVSRVPAVKGQAMAAYDPRCLKGTGVTYATSPMGADHTAGNVLPSPANPDYDPSKPEGQWQISEFVQCYFAAVDTLGLCLFASLPVVESEDLQAALTEAVVARWGRDLPGGSLIGLGRLVCLTEKAFNRRAGFGPDRDRLPEFFAREPLPPHGYLWDVADEDLDRVFSG